jgi:hypothetical protein
MEREAMQSMVKVGGQWITLTSFREAKQRANDTADRIIVILLCLCALGWIVVRA